MNILTLIPMSSQVLCKKAVKTTHCVKAMSYFGHGRTCCCIKTSKKHRSGVHCKTKQKKIDGHPVFSSLVYL